MNNQITAKIVNTPQIGEFTVRITFGGAPGAYSDHSVTVGIVAIDAVLVPWAMESVATLARRINNFDPVVEELIRLRTFADWVMDNLCDGDVHDKADELGLIEPRPVDIEDSIDGEPENWFTVWTPWKEDK